MKNLPFFLIIFLCSCNKEYEPKGYINLIDQSNTHSITSTVGNYCITMKHKPASYLTFKELMSSNSDINKEEYNHLLKQFTNNLHFDIIIDSKDEAKKTEGLLGYSSTIQISKIYVYNKDNLVVPPLYISKVKYQHQLNQWSVLFANNLKSLTSNIFKVYISFISGDGIVQESVLSFDKDLLEEYPSIIFKTNHK